MSNKANAVLNPAGIFIDGPRLFTTRTLQARNIWVPVGNVYYVDGRVTSSGNGLSWSKAYKTIAEANTVMQNRIDWAASPWANNDICFIGPGTYAENLTTLAHGCWYVGAGWDMRDGQFGTKIKPATGAPIDVGAAVNIGFTNIGFESPGTYPAFDSDILNSCFFDNCYFTGPAETSTITACIVTKDAVMNRIIECIFSCADKGIDVNYADANDSFSHNKIIDCIFDQIDSAGIEISSSLVGPSSLVKRCSFHGAGVTMSYAISDGSAILDVSWCDAESTSGFNGVRSVNASYNNGALVT